MDSEQVYIPLLAPRTDAEGASVATTISASITALARQTGAVRWTVPIETAVPPAVDSGRVFVAADTEIHALDSATGSSLWKTAIPGRVRTSMRVKANVLLALTEPDQLIAVRLDTHEIAWRVTVGAGRVLMNADDRAAYVTTADSRIVCVLLATGSVAWERKLAGTLGEPVLGRDRVLIGSTTDSLWSLDSKSGDQEWAWVRRIFGGDIVGATVDEDVLYVVSLDNNLRALERNGSQRWKSELPTRPVFPPRAFFGTVVVAGLSPAVSTFLAKTGVAVSTWAPPPPADAELQGPPLIDEHLQPFGVAMVVILRDGRVVGVRPTGMTFPEPAAAPLKFVPGRSLPPERVPGSPPESPAPAR
jgi:outer membrane protein assembly factor BamB